MQFRCSAKELISGLDIITHAVARRSTLPILGNVLLSVRDGMLTMITTDLEVGMQHYMPVNEILPGAISVPFQAFRRFLESLPEDTVDIAMDGQTTLILTSASFQCAISGLPADEFPILPRVSDADPECHLFTQPLCEAIRHTLFAVSTDESRLILTGLFFHWVGDRVTLVATDTHRLSMHSFYTPTSHEPSLGIIIPSKTVQILQELLVKAECCRLFIGESNITFIINDTYMVSRIIDGGYPDHKRVIPKDHNRTFLVARQHLLAALRRAKIATENDGNKILFDVTPSSLILSARQDSFCEVSESLPIQLAGPPGRTAYNIEYLQDVLKAYQETEQVRISLAGDKAPALITNPNCDDYCYVVMPMEFNEKDFPVILDHEE